MDCVDFTVFVIRKPIIMRLVPYQITVESRLSVISQLAEGPTKTLDNRKPKE